MKKLLLGAAGVLLAGAAVALAYGLLNSPDGGAGRPAEPGTSGPRASHAPQAPWRIAVYPAASGTNPKRKARARVEDTRPELARLVRRLYFALFLDRAELPTVARRYFETRARRALLRSDAGLPATTEQVSTRMRRARIGVEGWSANRAAARVDVIARALEAGRRVRVRHRGLLWLERTGHGWRVIAFELDQRLLRSNHRRGSNG
jgi:hypothetical protein